MVVVGTKPVNGRVAREVEWTIGNKCNMSCDYCPVSLKDGSQNFLPLRDYKLMIDKITNFGNEQLHFHLTGGEPTLYEELLELIKYIKQKNSTVALMTNGTGSPEIYQSISDQLASLIVGIHPQTDLYALENKSGLNPNFIFVAAVKNQWDWSVLTYLRLKKFFTKAVVILKPLYRNEIWKNSEITAYEDFQMKYIVSTFPKLSSIDLMIETTESLDRYFPHEAILTRVNQFSGLTCLIGTKRINIVGRVAYRGVCREGQSIPLKFSTTNLICSKKYCLCGGDIQQERHRL